jgi:hypothetical protein
MACKTYAQVTELLSVWRSGGTEALDAHKIQPLAWEESQALPLLPPPLPFSNRSMLPSTDVKPHSSGPFADASLCEEMPLLESHKDGCSTELCALSPNAASVCRTTAQSGNERSCAAGRPNTSNAHLRSGQYLLQASTAMSVYGAASSLLTATGASSIMGLAPAVIGGTHTDIDGEKAKHTATASASAGGGLLSRAGIINAMQAAVAVHTRACEQEEVSIPRQSAHYEQVCSEKLDPPRDRRATASNVHVIAVADDPCPQISSTAAAGAACFRPVYSASAAAHQQAVPHKVLVPVPAKAEAQAALTTPDLHQLHEPDGHRTRLIPSAHCEESAVSLEGPRVGAGAVDLYELD